MTDPSIGVGWFHVRAPDQGDWDERVSGSLSRDHDWLSVTLLQDRDEARPTAEDLSIEAVAGFLPDEEVLLFQVQRSGWTVRYGTQKPSTRHLRARTAVHGLSISALSEIHPVSVEAHFHGVGVWSGLAGATETNTTDPTTGLLMGFSMQLQSSPGVVVALHDGLELELGTTWSVDGPAGHRAVRSPASIKVRASSGEPRPVGDLLEPLFAVQDLMNCAHGAFIPATGGRADFRRTEQGAALIANRDWPLHGVLWNGGLAEARPGATRLDGVDAPGRAMLGLASVGGVEALPRWIDMLRRHRRPLSPLVDRFRHGAPYDFAEFLTLVAACEAWMQTFASKTDYQGQKFNLGMATVAGPHFKEWCGGYLREWAAEVTKLNQLLKHVARGDDPDPWHLSVIVEALWTLLLCNTMNYLAGSMTPSEHIVTSVQRNDLGRRLRRLLQERSAEYEAKEPSTT